MKRQVTDFLLYRWRYIIGWTAGTMIIIGVLVLTAFFIPDGLRSAEKISSIDSSKLSFEEFDPATVINLPYHLLQRLSFEVLGVTQFSIKLPSLIFGLIGIFGAYALILTWFKQKVAIIIAMIIATLPVFMFMTQDGTPAVYSFAVSTWLLTLGTFITRLKTPRMLWKIIFLILLALNLYTPLGIYLNIAIMSTLIFHPHIRILMRKFNPNRLVVASIAGALVSIPLIFSLITEPQLILRLLGIPDSMPSIFGNLSQILNTLAGFSSENNPLIQPMFSIPIIILLALGTYQLLKIKYTARSYIVCFWGLMLIPVILFSPSYLPNVVPLVLIILAFSLDGLIRDWYKLFPKNPYARIGGLFPLGLIITGIITSSFIAYGLGYRYSAATLEQFDSDLALLDQAIDKSTSDKPIKLYVNKSDEAFYSLVASHRSGIKIAIASKEAYSPNSIYHYGAKGTLNAEKYQPSYIVTNSRAENADRFYVYSEVEK